MIAQTACETTSVGDAGSVRGPVLLALARNAIAYSFESVIPPVVSVTEPDVDAYPWLHERAACFVTLHSVPSDVRRHGPPRLRGCIGTIDPYRSLLEDVRGNAVAAAFRDPRFPPLPRAAYPHLRVEVSVLSERERLSFADRADVIGQLRPGLDGLILTYEGRRGTYLPQVWAQLPEPDAFLTSLVTKARLPAGFWSDDIEVWRYTVAAFKEDR
ncbi:MAG: AmmeMemoRadiSam system protein A [Dermatophilaceae bacterium]